MAAFWLAPVRATQETSLSRSGKQTQQGRDGGEGVSSSPAHPAPMNVRARGEELHGDGLSVLPLLKLKGHRTPPIAAEAVLKTTRYFPHHHHQVCSSLWVGHAPILPGLALCLWHVFPEPLLPEEKIMSPLMWGEHGQSQLG